MAERQCVVQPELLGHLPHPLFKWPGLTWTFLAHSIKPSLSLGHRRRLCIDRKTVWRVYTFIFRP